MVKRKILAREASIAGYSVGSIIEFGDSVIVFTKATKPIRIKGWERSVRPYEARLLAELLMRPNAREIGEQLLGAVAELNTEGDD